MTCPAVNEYGHECVLEEDHGPTHVCNCADEWELDANGETVWPGVMPAAFLEIASPGEDSR